MINSSDFTSPLSPRPQPVVKNRRRQTLVICVVGCVLLISGALLFVFLAASNKSQVSSGDVRTQIVAGENKIILGDFEVCDWEAVDLDEVPIYVDGVEIEKFEQGEDMLIEGVLCGTTEEVILALDDIGLHGSIVLDDDEELVVTPINSDVSEVNPSKSAKTQLYTESEKTEAVGQQFERDLQKIAATPTTRRGDKSDPLEPGSVDIHLHLDIDSDMVSHFGSEYAAARYGVELVAIVNRDAYIDLGFNLKVVSINVRSSRLSQTGTTFAYLDELEKIRPEYNVNLLHSLTTRDIGGGVAYRGGLYSMWTPYGVSGSLDGEFGMWDRVVVAHELGHNFGAPHTHEMDPAPDTCGVRCPSNPSGTLMSYCHICPGGLNNIIYTWSSEAESIMLSSYNAWGNYLAARTECASLESAPDMGVEFYLKASVGNCLSLETASVTDCPLESVWSFDGSQMHDANDDNMCWSTDCKELIIQDCDSQDTKQQFEFDNGKLTSVHCGTSLKYDTDDKLTFDLAGGAVDQWCLPDADPNGTTGDATTIQEITCGAVVTGNDFNWYGEKKFSFTAPGGPVTISTCGSNFDTMLRLQTRFSIIATADDEGNCGFQAMMEDMDLDAGVEHTISLTGFNRAQGTWQIEITCAQMPESASPTTSVPTQTPTVFQSDSPTTSNPSFAPTTSLPTSSPVVNVFPWRTFSPRAKSVCHERNLLQGKWNNLGNKASLEDCGNACLDRSGCKFVSFRHDTGVGQCSAFSKCSLKDANGEFSVLDMSPEPAPTTTSSSTSSAPTISPTASPTMSTVATTSSPSRTPTESPTLSPTFNPTSSPTALTVTEAPVLSETFVDVYGTKGGDSARTTCDQEGKLSQACKGRQGCTVETCEVDCLAVSNCSFFFSNERGACFLYDRCDKTRRPSVPGWTMQRTRSQ